MVNTFISIYFKSIFFFFSIAVKCNDDTNVIKLLAYLGAGFDCASKVNNNNEKNC
jgi:diaminopimelate decarboxylase